MKKVIIFIATLFLIVSCSSSVPSKIFVCEDGREVTDSSLCKTNDTASNDKIEAICDCEEFVYRLKAIDDLGFTLNINPSYFTIEYFMLIAAGVSDTNIHSALFDILSSIISPSYTTKETLGRYGVAFTDSTSGEILSFSKIIGRTRAAYKFVDTDTQKAVFLNSYGTTGASGMKILMEYSTDEIRNGITNYTIECAEYCVSISD